MISRKHSLQSDFNPVGLKVGTTLFSEIWVNSSFSGASLRKFRKMTACTQIRPEFSSSILRSHPKKVDFGKHTFQSRCSHLLGVQISCNFVQRLACGFCGDVLGVQTSCSFVQFCATAGVRFLRRCSWRANFVQFCGVWFLQQCSWRANFVQIRGPIGAWVLEQSFGSEVCAIFGHAKFCGTARNFTNFCAICPCADMLGKISRNRLYQFCS